jgi:Xaa-Pro aminopeptidase
MFQNFESAANPAQGRERVERLREKLAEMELDGFLVPRADEHQGEYVAPRSERLQWLTGFTGSAGAALILRDSAVVFVDGRYTLQVREQVDLDIFTIDSLIDNPPHKWLGENAAKGWRIGFDPWLHTISDARSLRKSLEKQDGALVPVDRNLVDAVWDDQPAAPVGAISVHPEPFAGEGVAG